MTTLTRDAMLNTAIPVRRERVDVPEFGDGAYVYVYELTAGEKSRLDASMMKPDMTGVDKRKAVNMKPRTIIATVRDDNGASIFTLDDVQAISDWPSSVLERLHDVAHELNNGTSVEEHEKNSAETQSD